MTSKKPFTKEADAHAVAMGAKGMMTRSASRNSLRSMDNSELADEAPEENKTVSDVQVGSSRASSGRQIKGKDDDESEFAADDADEADDEDTPLTVAKTRSKRTTSGQKRKNLTEDEDTLSKKTPPAKRVKSNIGHSSPAHQTPKSEKYSTRFKGVSSNGRQKGRQLVFWSHQKNEGLILLLVFYMAQMGVVIPWDRIAQHMFPEKSTSGQAVMQHLGRLRDQILHRGGWVPPHPGRPGDSNKEQRPAFEIRGYLGKIGGANGEYTRTIAWNEDCSSMWDEHDIAERRRNREGPKTIEGLPNKRPYSDMAVKPDLSPTYTSDYDEDFEYDPEILKKTPLRKSGGRKPSIQKSSTRKPSARKPTARKLSYNDEDIDIFTDNDSDFVVDDTPSKKKGTMKKTLTSKPKVQKSRTDNIMTLLDGEDDYVSDEIGFYSNKRKGQKHLVVKMMIDPSKLAALSKKNNEESCETIPAFYDSRNLDQFTRVAPGNFPSGRYGHEDKYDKNEVHKEDELELHRSQSESDDDEALDLEHTDDRLSEVMYPGAGGEYNGGPDQGAGHYFNDASNMKLAMEHQAGHRTPAVIQYDAEKSGITNSSLSNLAPPSSLFKTVSTDTGGIKHSNIAIPLRGDQVTATRGSPQAEEKIKGNLDVNKPHLQEFQKPNGQVNQAETKVLNPKTRRALAVSNWFTELDEPIPKEAVAHNSDDMPIFGADIQRRGDDPNNQDVFFQYKHLASGQLRWAYKKKKVA